MKTLKLTAAIFVAVLAALLVYRYVDREFAEWREEVHRLVDAINKQHEVFVHDGFNNAAMSAAGDELLRIDNKLVPLLEHKPFGASLSAREAEILSQVRAYLAKRARQDAEEAAKVRKQQ